MALTKTIRFGKSEIETGNLWFLGFNFFLVGGVGVSLRKLRAAGASSTCMGNVHKDPVFSFSKHFPEKLWSGM